MNGWKTVSRGPAALTFGGTILFLSIHVILALFLRNNEMIATVYALATLAAGLWFAFSRETAKVTYVCAYIAGAEVLWRMSSASVFWEFGKYATAAILLVAIVRSGRPIHWLAIFYFATLLPSTVFTLADRPWSSAEQQVSFYLSGPLAILLCLWYFSGVNPEKLSPFRLAVAAMGPISGIATISLYSTLTATDLAFTRNSNRITSGGFGPNEVSSALGMGAVLCLFFLISGRMSLPFKALLACCSLLFATLSTITFSRGGMYMAMGSITASLFYLMRDQTARRTMSVALPALFLMAVFLIFPSVNRFTEGFLAQRFTQTQLTGRDSLLRAEGAVWLDNPIFGVGPGMSRAMRNNAASHTELTRMLSDHGLFGLASMILLVTISAKNVVGGISNVGRAFSLLLVVWAFLFMLTAALRLVAPAFFIGLSAIGFANRHFGALRSGRRFRCRWVDLVPASETTLSKEVGRVRAW